MARIGRLARVLLAGVATLGVAACVHVKVDRGGDASAERAEIVAMMARSATSWNRGDLDAFMDDYEGAATYVGRNRLLRGKAEIRTAYASRFAPGGTRDSLSFENVEVDVLGENVVNTIAWYRLSRGDSTVAKGPTSLVMRKADGRWRIVHDHSS